MAAMTLQDLLNDVEARLNDSNYQAASQANLTRWVNLAQQDLGEYAQIQAPPYTFSSQQGVQIYPLPADCLKARSLTWLVNGVTVGCSYLHLDEFENLSQNTNSQVVAVGTTPYWTVWGNEIMVWPVPSENGSNDLALYYYQQPADLVNLADVSLLPYRYQEALVLYAYARALEQQEEFQYAQYTDGLYNAMKQRLQQQASSHQRERPPRARLKYGV